MGKQRLHYIDNARGLASILGVFFHVGLMINHNYGNGVNIPMFDSFVTYFNSVRMPLFIFIAGYFTFYSLKKYSTVDYFRKRFERIGIPLLFGLILILPLDLYLEDLLLSLKRDEPIVWHYFDFLHNFKFDHLWFLYRILIYSTVFIILFHIIKKSDKTLNALRSFFKFLFSKIVVFIIVIGLLIIMIRKFGYFNEIILEEAHIEIEDVFFPIHTMFAQFVLFFLGGMALRYDFLFEDKILTANNKSILIMLGIYLVSALLLFFVPFGQALSHQMLIISLLFLLLNIFKRKLNYTNKYLKYISDASYPFYIIHYPLSMLMVYLFIISQLSTGFLFMDYLIVCIITIASTYLLYSVLVRSNPVGKFIISGIIWKRKKNKIS